MSVSAPAVQPEPATQPEGQGGEPGGAPFQEYLDRIPEEHRALVEPVFREWDGNVTKRFQEHAQQLSQWEPYEQIGLTQYEPDTIARLVAFAEEISTPEAYLAWLQEQAKAAGLLQAEPAVAPAAGELDPSIVGAVEQLLSPLQQAVEGLVGWQQQQQEWQQQQELSSYQQEAQAEYAAAYAELQEQHGEIPAEALERFADRYVGTCDPREVVQKAFADYQAFVAQVEQGVFTRKLDAPAPPQTGGATPPPTTAPESLADAHAAAATRLRANRQA